MVETAKLAELVGGLLNTFRTSGVPIHCIASSTEESFTSRVLDAIGCVVNTTHDPREVGSFMAEANALLVQMGSTSDMREGGISTAVEECRKLRKPWLLDTSFAARSPFRTELVRSQIAHRPAIVRSAPNDLNALTARTTVSVQEVARRFQTVAMLCDHEKSTVSDGVRTQVVYYGALELLNVRMLGSARSALCTAMLSVERDAFSAAIAGAAIIESASAVAAEAASGPGSFSIQFLDALYSLSPEQIAQRLVICDAA